MSSPRIHSNVAVVVGGRGTGKTTFVKQITDVAQKPKTLVVDTFHHPSYSSWPVMQTTDLPRWQTGKYHLHGSNTDEILYHIENHCKNTLIVFEDAAKYVNQNPQLEVKRICLDSKQRNNDVIFIYHSFAEVPKSFLRWIDFVTIFKTQEVIENQKTRLYGFDKILPVWQAVNKHPNQYYHQTIQLL